VRTVKNVDGVIMLSDIEDAMDDRTRLVPLSFVEWANGFKHDLEPLAKLADEHNAYVLVDADQGVGAMDLDVKKTGVHFVVEEGHKWLNGPWGMGFLYVKQDLISELEPVFTRVENFRNSWDWVRKEHTSIPPDPIEDGHVDCRLKTYANMDLYDLGFHDTAERFSQSPHSQEALAGMVAALKYVNNLGIKNIERRDLKLASYLIDGLHEIGVEVVSPLEKKHRSAMVVYQASKDEWPRGD
jgi:selenocysteine lyase/cysteine desulfurase